MRVRGSNASARAWPRFHYFVRPHAACLLRSDAACLLRSVAASPATQLFSVSASPATFFDVCASHCYVSALQKGRFR